MSLSIYIFISYLIHFVTSSIHIPPTIDDVILGFQQENIQSSRVKRALYPFQIHPHYNNRSLDVLDTEQVTVLRGVMGEAIEYFKNTLKIPLTPSVHLNHNCDSYYKNGRKLCSQHCTIPKCGDYEIPSIYLSDCMIKGEIVEKQGGPGAAAHFILFISLNNSTTVCNDRTMIAFAAHCQQGEKDRPIAGYINVCPNKLKTSARHREMLLSTFIHEIIHALAFSPSLLAFYHDSNGNPRTQRNPRTNLPMRVEKGRYLADDSTIQIIERKNWWLPAGTYTRNVTMLVTENAKREARSHFDCDELEGVELEDQGGIGTAMAHLEKRIFENEAMCGSHTQDPVFSRISLAILEDTGWYTPDYSKAQTFEFGKGLGCNFVMKSCAEWINTMREKNQSVAPYCDEPKSNGIETIGTTRCSNNHDSVRVCNLIPYSRKVDWRYRNFARIDNIPVNITRFYGGSNVLADYCPYYQEFEWTLKKGHDPSDSRCEITENNNKRDKPTFESFGASSICLNYKQSWMDHNCGNIRGFKTIGAGCHQYKCEDNQLHIGITYNNETKFYWCPQEGATIKVYRNVDKWVRTGIIICPSCEKFCDGCISRNFTGVLGDETLDYCPGFFVEMKRTFGDFISLNFSNSSYIVSYNLTVMIVVFVINLLC